ncbi:MAG: amidohydrolase family protein [Bacteroidales bacterium]|nr:amidohydrolase family protein [Bacteroidales bacterium]
MTIIDAHTHLWLRQDAVVDGQHIEALPGGRSRVFGEERQMLPPFLIDGRNSAEVFLSNMDYAQVGAAVVVQEIIDGNQDAYLLEVQRRYPDRFLCCALLDIDRGALTVPEGWRAASIPGHRMHRDLDSPEMMAAFKEMERRGIILSMCLDDNPRQIAQFATVIRECPSLRIAIGHFGLARSEHWLEQVQLARAENVRIESGGITWLYHDEFYPFPGAVRAIRQAADEVGMDKLMWGSDYPRTITAITYRMSYDFILRSPEISPEDKAAFLGGNALSFYGFHDLPELPYIKNMSE